MDRKADEKPDRPLKPVFPPDANVPNPMGLSTAEINDGLDFLVEYGRQRRAEKAAAGPVATERNALGLDDDEIERGLDILAESNREWDRLQAEKAARGEPVPPDDPD